MRLVFTLFLLSIAIISRGQKWIVEDTADAVFLKQSLAVSAPSSYWTTTDRKGGVESITYNNDSSLIFNYKAVPLGYYCDTSFEKSVSGVSYMRLIVFYDRKPVVYFSAHIMRGWVWSAYVDTNFFVSRGQSLR